MANEEQLAILRQGAKAWNKWREDKPLITINFIQADLKEADLSNLNLKSTIFAGANLSRVALWESDLRLAVFDGANLAGASMGNSIFGETKLDKAVGLEQVEHLYPSNIDTKTLQRSKGRIPEQFLRGCGLNDWEIEAAKLYNPDLSNDEFIDIQNSIFDLRRRQAIQISPLFISYSHADSTFVDKVGNKFTEKGVRYWRDIHEMKAGKIEKQIDQAISQNRAVLLVLSEHSLSSDWVEHEVRTARQLEKDMGRDVLCPVTLDDSWKSSRWPKRIMEQVTEYNILDFSAWEDDIKFEGMFRKLIDGLELFYKG